MGRSLGRECNFEKVCFELGTEYWQRRRVSGIRREWIPESWTNDRESPFAKWWSDIWNGKNKWIRRSCRNSMWRKWKTIVKICRLLICECFVCEKTEFVIDSLFDWKPVKFFEYWWNSTSFENLSRFYENRILKKLLNDHSVALNQNFQNKTT